MPSVIDFLSDKRVVASSAFLWGFIQDTKIDKQLLDSPLNTLLVGSIRGGLYTAGASLVVVCMPKEMTSVVSVLCLVAVGKKVTDDICATYFPKKNDTL